MNEDLEYVDVNELSRVVLSRKKAIICHEMKNLLLA